MPVLECRHIYAGGRKCQSPALRGQQRWFYHARAARLRTAPPASAAPAIPSAPPVPWSARLLEDPDSIQLAISETLAGVASGEVDLPRARVLLFGLRIAATNLRHTRSTSDPFTVQQTFADPDDHSNDAPLGPAVQRVLPGEEEETSCPDCEETCDDDDDCDCECHEVSPEDEDQEEEEEDGDPEDDEEEDTDDSSEDEDGSNVSCDICINHCHDSCRCRCHADEPDDILDLARRGARMLGMRSLP